MDFIEVNNAVLDAERTAPRLPRAGGGDRGTDVRRGQHGAPVRLAALAEGNNGRAPVHMRTGALSGDVNGLFLAAHYVLGVRTFRTVRAARAVLAAGWEPEVAPHIRVLLALQAHQRVIDEDPRALFAAGAGLLAVGS